MRTRIGIFALLMTAWFCGEARSAGWSDGTTRRGDFFYPRVGTNPAGTPGCCDDVWCPVYVYFAYNPDARRQQTLREYLESRKRLQPGVNQDVFAIPPLPYGPGRSRPGASHIMTAAPAAAPASTPAAAAAPTPPALP